MKKFVLLLISGIFVLSACSAVRKTERKVVDSTCSTIKKVDHAIDNSLVGDIDRWQQENLW